MIFSGASLTLYLQRVGAYDRKKDDEIVEQNYPAARLYVPKDGLNEFQIQLQCWDIARMVNKTSPFKEFIKVQNRTSKRNQNLVFEYCALNLFEYHHPNLEGKKNLRQMVRAYLGAYKICPRCNYHSWSINDAAQHNQHCKEGKKFVLRSAYKFPAIERNDVFEPYTCFFCNTDKSYPTEIGLAQHCLDHHPTLLHYIGLNSWECYRVAHGKLPDGVQAIKYKRKPTTIKDLIMEVTAGNDAALNQSKNQDNQSGQQLADAEENKDVQNEKKQFTISLDLTTPSPEQQIQLNKVRALHSSTAFTSNSQTPCPISVNPFVTSQNDETINFGSWYRPPNSTQLSTLSSFANPFFNFLLGTAEDLLTLNCGCEKDAANRQYKFVTISGKCHHMMCYPMKNLINNIDASERCLKVFNNTRLAIDDQNLKSQTPALVSLLKSDYNIYICISLHPNSKTLLEWAVDAEPGPLENLIQTIRGRLNLLQTLNMMQGAVHSNNIYVHGEEQHCKPYFVDWGNLKQFTLESHSFMYPQVRPQYLLSMQNVNGNNDLYSLLWVIADTNYSKQNKSSDQNDVPSNWLENESKMTEWALKSNSRGHIDIPDFVRDTFPPTDRSTFTTRTFEEMLAFYTSFDGKSDQLMRHQAEYYQTAIKFLNESEYTHVVPEGEEKLIYTTIENDEKQ